MYLLLLIHLNDHCKLCNIQEPHSGRIGYYFIEHCGEYLIFLSITKTLGLWILPLFIFILIWNNSKVTPLTLTNNIQFLIFFRYYLCVERKNRCLARGKMENRQFIPLPRYGRGRQELDHHNHLRNPEYGIRNEFKQKLRKAVLHDLKSLRVVYNEISKRYV